MESPYPFIIYYWSINIHWHFYLNRHFNLNLDIFLDWPVNVNRFFYKDWLVNNDRIFIYRLLNEYLFLNDLGYFNFLDYDFWNLFLNLHILWHFYYPLYNSFRAWNVFRNLNFDFNRFLNN